MHPLTARPARLLLYLLSAVIHYLFVAVWDSLAAERRALESQVHAREAELRALRAQLSPRLVVSPENPVDEDQGERPGTGTGISNVRRRLAALCPSGH